jgi:hypothetical protein
MAIANTFQYDPHGFLAQGQKLRDTGVVFGQRASHVKNVLRKYPSYAPVSASAAGTPSSIIDQIREAGKNIRKEVVGEYKRAEKIAKSRRAAYEGIVKTYLGGEAPMTVEELWKKEKERQQEEAEKQQAKIRGIQSGAGGPSPEVIPSAGGKAGTPPVAGSTGAAGTGTGAKDETNATQAITKAEDEANAAAAENTARKDWERNNQGLIEKHKEGLRMRDATDRAEAEAIRRRREAMYGTKVGVTIAFTQPGITSGMTIERIGRDGKWRAGDNLVSSINNQLIQREKNRKAEWDKTLKDVDDIIKASGGVV